MTIENICFKGGGMKGLAFVGVDKALTELGLWKNIKRFIGSSAGAIFASAAACRIPFDTMLKEIDNTDFTKFKDSHWGWFSDGYYLYEESGIYKGDYFYNWYRDLLKKYVGNPDITFEEVYKIYGTQLVITTTNLTKHKLIYLNRNEHPNEKLCDAVRKSMSIPVFFTPVIENGDVYVDGGITNNFPLDYFDTINNKTLGFYLDENINYGEINNVIKLVISVINTCIETIEKNNLKDSDKNRIVHIKTWDYSPIDFHMSKQDINKLIESGYNATIDFLHS